MSYNSKIKSDIILNPITTDGMCTKCYGSCAGTCMKKCGDSCIGTCLDTCSGCCGRGCGGGCYAEERRCRDVL